jgi:hypothetical protein
VIDPAQIGILTGLDLEASLIAAAVPHASLAVAPIVAMSGGDPARARTEAQRLVDAGCALLLSYGFAGALEPRLRPGTIVVPERVLAEDGAEETIAALAMGACATSKSEDPLSPTVAGPIGGVSISAPKLLEPGPGAQINTKTQPLTLLIEMPIDSAGDSLF